MTKNPRWRLYWHKRRKKWQILLRLRTSGSLKKQNVFISEHAEATDAIVARNDFIHSVYGPGGLTLVWSSQRQRVSLRDRLQQQMSDSHRTEDKTLLRAESPLEDDYDVLGILNEKKEEKNDNL